MYNVRKQHSVDLERKAIAKFVRTNIKMHFAALAEIEVDRVLPHILDKHSEAIARGEEFTFTAADLDAITDELGQGQ